MAGYTMLPKTDDKEMDPVSAAVPGKYPDVIEKFVTNRSVDALIEGVISKLDTNSIYEDSTEKFTGEQLKYVMVTMDTFLLENYKTKTEDLLVHLAMIQKRLCTISTSTKTKFRDKGCISYVQGGLRYKLMDKVVFPFIISKFTDRETPNALRKYACTFEELHLCMARLRPDLYENKGTTKAGTPHLKGYLSADFLTGSLPGYSEHERGIILRASESMLARRQGYEEATELLNLRDLGKYL
uniref:Minor coat protein n=1 Tax=Citrus tristeza virus TaxID=12162 RepID=Q52SL5_9CLOS|nr:minor coat protein [Citrus tristeza virus]